MAPLHDPPYIDWLLDERERAGHGRKRQDLYLHLGYWDTPESMPAGSVELDLAAQERLNERILEMARLGDSMAVLDVGCGIGGTLAAVNNRFADMRLVGLNVGLRQLAIAQAAVKARVRNQLDWVRGDACQMPFDDHTFDRILAVESAQHFPSRRRFLSEAARLLHPGGRLVISDFVPTTRLARARHEGDPIVDAARRITTVLGPWPDFWGEERCYAAVEAASGLRLEREWDATPHVLPGFVPRPGLSQDNAHPVDAATALLGDMLRRGLLRLLFFAFHRETGSSKP